MLANPRFNHILQPGFIGRVKTRNRMVKTGSGMALAESTGHVGPRNLALYEALARGGVGLILAGSCSVDRPLGIPVPETLSLSDDKYIQSFSELAEVVHRHNCPVFLQLMHSGPWHQKILSGLQPISASSLAADEIIKLSPPFLTFEEPRELTIPEIKGLVTKFADAAVRAQKAGFDGVELDASSNHLCNTFLSRAWNKRRDIYGFQTMENRTRFVVEIVREIKNRVGKDFPLSVCINGAEYGVENGITIEESKIIAQILQNAGADSLHIRGFGYNEYNIFLSPEQVYYPEPQKPFQKELDWTHRGIGATVPLAEAIKKVVSIPVITVGRLDPVMGERVLKAGKADFIGMTRRLLADPELPNKVAANRLKDIVPCTACMHCAPTQDVPLENIGCRVNAALRGVQEYSIKPASVKKKVMIVGGGPAGLEAARVAAVRGHEVILYERERKLGGLLPMVTMIQDSEVEDLPSLVSYFKRQLTKLKVDVRLGREFTAETVEEFKPDVLIMATGGREIVPDIPGINRHNVASGYDLHSKVKPFLRFFGPRLLGWLTRFWMPIGKRVVIIGGQLQGCELAEFLVKRNRKVVIVESSNELGTGLVAERKPRLFYWFNRQGVTVLSGVKYEEITDRGLNIVTKEGQRKTLEADTIITAMALAPDMELEKALEGKASEVYAIGDCKAAGLIIDAISDGYHVTHDI
jgi:2,4-dienoyl-CoA reductase (NADPH2)